VVRHYDRVAICNPQYANKGKDLIGVTKEGREEAIQDFRTGDGRPLPPRPYIEMVRRALTKNKTTIH
jgi:hypothetical protein